MLGQRKLSISLLAATSLIGGLAEAAFLVVITRTGFAVAEGDSSVELFAGDSRSIGTALALALVLVTVRMALSMSTITLSARLITRVVTDIRRDLARAFLRASFPTQQRARSGQLQELLTTFATQGTNLVGSMVSAIVAGFNLVALIALAVAVDPAGSIGIILAGAILAAVLRPIRSMVKREARATAQSGMDFATSLSEMSGLGMEVHIFNVQRQTESRVVKLIEHDARRKERLAVLRGLVPTLYTGLAFFALVGAIAVVAALDSANLTTLGPVMLVMLRSLSYGQALQVASASVASARPFVESLHTQLSAYKDAEVVDHGQPIGAIGTLTLDSVSFEYEPGRPVLKDVHASIAPCEVVGIIGPSGSGKSTLVQLMLGLREPTAGRILAEGRDAGRLSRAEWARKVTFVPQAAHLISGTVAENIRFMRKGVDQDSIERASRLAQLHSDVEAWSEGYDRQVGERGDRLSGGQQQRLCIARALVEEPDVLILDEPTSSLDVRSEALIREALASLRQRMTVVIIAHRMSTLEICDRIMVIQDGHVKAFDTPANLERTSEFYLEALVLSGLRHETLATTETS